jgi:F-type H+-transporting ATPase subunit a
MPNSLILSPLEQFAIINLLPIRFGNIYLSFTNSALYLIIGATLVGLLFHLVTARGGGLIPSRWQSIVEMIVQFVASLVDEQIGKSGRVYFPLILTLFLFLLGANLVGMVPYSFTATSHLVVTFALSLTLFIGITLVGFQKHGLHFFSFLLPKGAPLQLAPLLVVLELVSYCFRAVSLGVHAQWGLGSCYL